MISISNLIIAQKELLAKPVWSCDDIQQYINCRRTKAFEIKKRAIALGGAVRGMPSKVKRDIVLEMLGINITAELEIINKFNGGNKQNE